MALSSYRLRPASASLLHGLSRPQLLHDLDDDVDRSRIDALVASGDCFTSLATTLAETIQQLAANPETAGPELKDIILTLLYLQDNYQIHPNPSK